MRSRLEFFYTDDKVKSVYRDAIRLVCIDKRTGVFKVLPYVNHNNAAPTYYIDLNFKLEQVDDVCGRLYAYASFGDDFLFVEYDELTFCVRIDDIENISTSNESISLSTKYDRIDGIILGQGNAAKYAKELITQINEINSKI